MDENAILLELYKVQVGRSEHYEGQHLKFAGLLLAVSSGLLAIASIDASTKSDDFAVGLLVLMLGVISVVSSWLHYERALRHGATAANIWVELSNRLPNTDLNELRAHIFPHRVIRLHHLWYVLGVVIMMSGLTVTLFSRI